MMSGATLLLLPVVGVAFVAMIELTIRRSEVGTALLLGWLVLYYAGVDLPFVSFGGMNVFLADVLAVVIATAAAARLLRTRQLAPGQYLLLLAVAVAAFSLIQGVAAFGLLTAVNESRRWIVLFATALYFSTVVPKDDLLGRIGKYWVIAAVALSAVAVGRWVALAVGLPPVGILQHGGHQRVLGANEAFFIAQAFFIAAPSAWRLRDDLTRRWTSIGLLIVAVLLQHRTVWIALLAGLAVLMFRDRGLARRFGVMFAVAVVVAGTVSVVVLDDDTEVVGARALDEQTFEWRVEGWRQLLIEDGPDTLGEVALGQPFGGGWERRMGRVVHESSPHSFYVEGLLRIGVVGMAALVAGYVLALWRMQRRRVAATDEQQLIDDVLCCLVATQLVYGISYFPPQTAGVVLGLAVAVGLGRWRSRGGQRVASVPAHASR